MSSRPNKMQKIVRLNQFREELANGVLRNAIHEQAQTINKHEDAVNAVESLGQWKAQKQADGGLDLALYNAVLEHEHHAMLQEDRLKREVEGAKRATSAAQKKMVEAASATKVSEQRQSRQNKHAELETEKHDFDQMTDVWLNNRERTHD